MTAKRFIPALLLGLGWSAVAGQPTKRPTDPVRGEELYRRHCVACHGTRNGGDGPATAALVRPVPALVNQTRPSDDAIRIVLRGKAAMPGYEGTFDRQDAVRVLKYMNQLGPKKEMPAVQTGPKPTPPNKAGTPPRNIKAKAKAKAKAQP